MTVMVKKNGRGGPRQPGPGKKLGRPEVPLDKQRKQAQWSSYPQDLENIERLINLGYANNKSEVIRKAIKEALDRVG
jgi:hypothetical protein